MESKALSDDLGPPKHRVGILYDERMCKHATPNGEYHPENPYRVRSIWNKLRASGITERFPLCTLFCLFFLCLCDFCWIAYSFLIFMEFGLYLEFIS